MNMGIGDEKAGGIKIMEKYFSGKHHVKFGHFVNFSYIYFRQKYLASQS